MFALQANLEKPVSVYRLLLMIIVTMVAMAMATMIMIMIMMMIVMTIMMMMMIVRLWHHYKDNDQWCPGMKQ